MGKLFRAIRAQLNKIANLFFEADPIAVMQLDCVSPSDGRPGSVNINTIAARIGEPERTIPELDAAVLRGDVSVRVGQHPVAIGCTANVATLLAKSADPWFDEIPAGILDDAQLETHRSPRGKTDRRTISSIPHRSVTCIQFHLDCGGRAWDRTRDPYHVKVVLYR